MMKIRLIIALFLAFCSFCCMSQREPVSGMTYMDQGRFDSVFRRHAGAEVPSTYFLITFNPVLSALTSVPEVIKAYKEVRRFSKSVPLFLVYPNNGVVSNAPGDEEAYFREIYFIDRKQDSNVRFIQSAALYDSLNVKSLMTKWFYVYHHRLIGGAASIKLNALSDSRFRFPKDVLHLSAPRKIRISQGNLRLSAFRDIIRPYKPGRIFYITDLNNNLHVLNTHTGEFERSFDKKIFDPFDFFCQYIAKSENDCKVAKTERALQYNRDPNYFSGVVYSDNKIYISTGFEMTVAWENSLYAGLPYMTYVNELGEKKKARYNFVGETYPAVLRLDTGFALEQASYLDIKSFPSRNKVPQKAGFWSGLDKGFYVSDSLIIVDNNPDAGLPLKSFPPHARHAYSAFKMKGGGVKYEFMQFYEPEYEKEHVRYMNWHNRTYYFEIKGRLYANLMFGGYVNRLGDTTVRYRLKGQGAPLIREIIPSYSEDTTWMKVNYRSLCAGSVLNKRFGVVIYFYQDRPTLEVLAHDRQTGELKTIQVTDLSRVEGFAGLENKSIIPHNGDGMCISDDKIYLTRFSNGEYYLYEYTLSLIKNASKLEIVKASRK